METDLDVAVIGGGQAGLAVARELGVRRRDAVVFDASPATGDTWRTRWDSLRLFTPAAYSSLPGMAFPGPAWHHPTKDEVARYLQDYRHAFDIDVRHSSPVLRVRPAGQGFRLDAPDGEVTARSVVVATGPYQTPAVPRISSQLDGEVVQLHSSEYRNPSQIGDGATVLVVGAGNSGVQIATELADRCHVHLAVGRPGRHVPQRLAGRDLFWWLTRLGMLAAPPDSRRGRRMQRTELIIGADREALERDVVTHDRIVGASGGTVHFEDGTDLFVDAVVWATGFTASHRFVEVPGALDARGLIDQRAGVASVPGLFTVGQPWQRNRGSSLLGFVGVDAALVADAVASRRTAPRQAVTAP